MNTLVRAESNTLLEQEAAIREALEHRLGIRTRAAELPGARALLLSGASPASRKGLVVDGSLGAAERIYLYLHLAAHCALRHNVPLVTIVEPRGDTDDDAALHDEAERLARAMWWGTAPDTTFAAAHPSWRGRLLRAVLRTRPGRVATRALLIAMRRAYYGLHMSRALGRSRVTALLRRALVVTAVVSAAPQLAAERAR